MSSYRASNHPSHSDLGRQQLAIISQLLKTVSTIQHIDELFQWLVYLIVQRFPISVAEIWTVQTSVIAPPSLQLRSLASRDPSIPQQVVTNNQITQTIGFLLTEQRSYPLQLAQNVFPFYPASLLARYGLVYCATHFQSRKTLLPPSLHDSSPEHTFSPLAALTLFFLRQPPPPDALQTVAFILDQAVTAAENHGLLLPPHTSLLAHSTPPPSTLPHHEPLPALLQHLPHLIPRRSKEAELLMSSNPLSRSVDISDKQARRLYAAIDGHKNMGELSAATGINLQEVGLVLYKLLAQRRIDLYTSDGQLVDPSQLLKEY